MSELQFPEQLREVEDVVFSKWIVSLAATVAVVAPLQALAGSGSAQVSVTGLVIKLVDLDPDDGIAPSIRYFDWGTDSPHDTIFEAFASSSIGTDSQYQFGRASRQSDPELLAKGQASAAVPNAWATAAATQSSLTASAYAAMYSESPVDEYSHVEARSSTSPSWSTIVGFTLSPKTALVIEGDYSLSASLVDGQSSPGRSDRAEATFELGANIFGARPFVWMGFSDSVWAVPRASSDTSPGGLITRSFSESLANRSASFVQGELQLFARANVDIYHTTLVPEPATWALALIGLGGLGLAARRRAA